MNTERDVQIITPITRAAAPSDVKSFEIDITNSHLFQEDDDLDLYKFIEELKQSINEDGE